MKKKTSPVTEPMSEEQKRDLMNQIKEDCRLAYEDWYAKVTTRNETLLGLSHIYTAEETQARNNACDAESAAYRHWSEMVERFWVATRITPYSIELTNETGLLSEDDSGLV